MGLEIEAKLKIERFGPIRQCLFKLGARRLGTTREHNLFFEQEDGSGKARAGRLRLRLLSPRRRRGSRGLTPVLTFKGPRTGGPFKSREEIELAVGDAVTMQRLLEAMGYVFKFSYEKRRETWKLGSCRVELDEVPFLGKFVEVEGPSERAVRRTLRQLGLADRPMIHHGYFSLLSRHLRKCRLNLTTVRLDTARRLAG